MHAHPQDIVVFNSDLARYSKELEDRANLTRELEVYI